MLALGIVLNILGFFCWVLFTLAIYARATYRETPHNSSA